MPATTECITRESLEAMNYVTELRKLAVKYGINARQTKEALVHAILIAAYPEDTKKSVSGPLGLADYDRGTWTPIPPDSGLPIEDNETDDQKRARLLAELSRLDPSPGGGQAIGSDFYAMSVDQLRMSALSQGVQISNVPHDRLILIMQQREAAMGLKPVSRPGGNGIKATGAFGPSGRCSVVPHTRDVCYLKDERGNVLAKVQRIGQWLKGQPVILDMERNAQFLATAFNSANLSG